MEDDEAYTVDLSNGSTVTITIPKEPSIGDVWLDSSSMDINVFSGNHDWISITGDGGSIDLNNIISEPVEFEDQMPSVAKVEDMCREYPALEKAYETFKTVYKLVHQDWQGKQDDQDSLF